MASLRQSIEDAIIAEIGGKLLRECNPLDGYLHFVGPYNGEIDQKDGPDDLLRVIRGRFPCVLVSATSASFRPETTQRTSWARVVSIELYVGSDHLRSREDRNRSDVSAENDPTCDPGIYQIMEDIFDCIAGNDFDLECVDYLEPSREDLLLQEKTATLWRLQYTTVVDARANKRDHGDSQLTAYGLDANLDPDDVTTPPNPFVEATGDIT